LPRISSFHKIGCHATSLEISEKEVEIDHLHSNAFIWCNVKIAKISSADPEIICLREIIKKDTEKDKIEEINASKIYSPVGNLAERAK